MKRLSTGMYHSAEHMQEFLRTLSYWSYYESNLPKWLIDAAHECGWKPAETLRLLDVGCGAGELTVPICQALGAVFDVKLWVIEPSSALLAGCVRRAAVASPKVELVHSSVASFQDLRAASDAFDIVLCSHSLYQPLEEGAVETNSLSADSVAKTLRHLLTPRGFFCTILASQHSWAYESKRRAYELLGIPAESFSHAERLRGALKRLGAVIVERTADTYADTSSFGCETAEARRRSLRWLSFFLRIDCESLSEESQDQIISIFSHRSIPFKSLPTDDQESCALYPAMSGVPTDETRVLFHKEIILVGR